MASQDEARYGNDQRTFPYIRHILVRLGHRAPAYSRVLCERQRKNWKKIECYPILFFAVVERNLRSMDYYHLHLITVEKRKAGTKTVQLK